MTRSSRTAQQTAAQNEREAEDDFGVHVLSGCDNLMPSVLFRNNVFEIQFNELVSRDIEKLIAQPEKTVAIPAAKPLRMLWLPTSDKAPVLNTDCIERPYPFLSAVTKGPLCAPPRTR